MCSQARAYQTSNGSTRPISSKDLDLLPLEDGTGLTKGAQQLRVLHFEGTNISGGVQILHITSEVFDPGERIFWWSKYYVTDLRGADRKQARSQP